MSGNRRDSPRTVAARLLAVLDSFSVAHAELTLTEISRRTGLAVTTTHRLVGQLHALGALDRDEHGRYSIGPRLRELARLSKAGRARHGGMVDRRPDAAAREVAAPSGDRHR
jgi:DNA-binding IclR family transcriptional regulator